MSTVTQELYRYAAFLKPNAIFRIADGADFRAIAGQSRSAIAAAVSRVMVPPNPPYEWNPLIDHPRGSEIATTEVAFPHRYAMPPVQQDGSAQVALALTFFPEINPASTTALTTNLIASGASKRPRHELMSAVVDALVANPSWVSVPLGSLGG